MEANDDRWARRECVTFVIMASSIVWLAAMFITIA